MREKNAQQGFTLIELMLVVAIIALLAAIAIPKFADMIIRAKEAAVKAKVGSVRSAFSIYYADNEGSYPYSTGWPNQLSFLVPKYINKIPAISIPTRPDHQPGNFTTDGSITMDPMEWTMMGPGRYIAYVVRGDGIPFRIRQIKIACLHKDSRGSNWSDF